MNKKTIVLEEIKQQIINDPSNKRFNDHGWVPIYSAPENAKIVIIGQAPGIKTQLKGRSFDDASGDKLREWLNITRETFYHSGEIAILPMDFYFPGKGKTGDLPPRKDFANKWHSLILKQLDQVALVILIGNYAQKHYLQENYQGNLTETVKNYKQYLPLYFPLPHPSPLNFRWYLRNEWFEKEVLINLAKIVSTILNKKR